MTDSLLVQLKWTELLQRADKQELRVQYREYLKRLEILSKVPANRELSDMELLELFLHPDNKQLYVMLRLSCQLWQGLHCSLVWIV